VEEIKAIIVDDEFSARNVLQQLLLRNCSNVHVLATCSNVPDAAVAIKKLNPDVVFLDVQMPNYNGYELMSFLDEVTFEIVFVTAYDQYALKAFELSATDYLLKPIKRERLKKAIDKVESNLLSKHKNTHYIELIESMQQKEFRQFVVSSTDGKHIIKFKNLVSVGGDGSYSTLYFTDKTNLILSKNLKYFQNILEVDNRFFRCHKSWIVNLDLIKSVSTTKLCIEMETGQNIKLSKTKKKELQDKLM